MLIRGRRKAHAGRLADAFQSRGDIDAVAHQIAVGLLDHVAQMNADPELDALVRRQAGVALDHGVLDLDRTAHGVNDAAEFDNAAIAGALDDPAVVYRDRGINEVAAERPEPRKSAFLVRSGEPAVADHIRDENRRYFPGLAHGAPLGRPSA